MLSGHATPAGTAAYAATHPAAAGHYRQAQGLTLSSVGLGTYLGRSDASSRERYQSAASLALAGGVNVLDTAANYRDQASERDLGQAIRAHADGGGRREHLLVATKAGFLHGDCDAADQDAWFHQEYLGAEPVLPMGDVLNGHSLAPAYVRHELARSRRNLGLETLDIAFLHNAEHPLEWGMPGPEYYGRVEDAFAILEEAVDQGHIRMYGVATWNGLRTPPDRQGHLELVKLVHHAGQARMRVGGNAGSHHFKAIEVPVNVAMMEAARSPTQPWRFGLQPTLACARELDLVVLASASLLQMRPAPGAPPSPHERLQAVRATPGVTSALVGMGDPDHARANVAFATATPAAGA